MLQFFQRNLIRAMMLVLVLCAGGTCLAAEGQAMILPVDPHPLVVDTPRGKAVFRIEIADDNAERGRGLMFRESMADDHGMLFVFEQTRQVGFWMKNTILPLDLVFIGEDGRVRAVRRGEPMSEALITPGDPVRFVLELTAGTAGKAGIGKGSLVRHPRIDAVDGLAD
ncbi:MAG: DUF192 domain-containing protein [Rhizobiales bacterium]|nr:DUF192 domain-containing protein [Hyphomicrobiales bacterium]